MSDCYNCGKHGHYARDCWADKKVEGKANYVEVKGYDEVLLMSQNTSASCSTRCTEGDTIWYLDSGASNHMTGHKHLFGEMTVKKGSVAFGDDLKV